jgi:glycerol-3-phosphate acyltransferase PlsX
MNTLIVLISNLWGTPVLGVTKPVVIGHGISHAKAFKNMIRVAQKMIETEVLERMKGELE